MDWALGVPASLNLTFFGLVPLLFLPLFLLLRSSRFSCFMCSFCSFSSLRRCFFCSFSCCLCSFASRFRSRRDCPLLSGDLDLEGLLLLLPTSPFTAADEEGGGGGGGGGGGADLPLETEVRLDAPSPVGLLWRIGERPRMWSA